MTKKGEKITDYHCDLPFPKKSPATRRSSLCVARGIITPAVVACSRFIESAAQDGYLRYPISSSCLPSVAGFPRRSNCFHRASLRGTCPTDGPRRGCKGKAVPEPTEQVPFLKVWAQVNSTALMRVSVVYHQLHLGRFVQPWLLDSPFRARFCLRRRVAFRPSRKVVLNRRLSCNNVSEPPRLRQR